MQLLWIDIHVSIYAYSFFWVHCFLLEFIPSHFPTSTHFLFAVKVEIDYDVSFIQAIKWPEKVHLVPAP